MGTLGMDAGAVPAPGLYPYQWNWDAAFCALGWITFDEPRAWRELADLAGLTDAVVVTSFTGKGAVDETARLAGGVLNPLGSTR